MVDINGKTSIYGVVGHPVAHSFSPYIHNLLANRLGINMAYIPIPVRPDDFVHLIKSLKTLGLSGCNITVPYKVDILNQLDEVEKKAQIIGAVNTVKIVNGHAIGYNTDVDGIEMACKKENILLKDKTILIIGAGGASHSVAVMCANAGAKQLVIVNRTLSKAAHLCHTIQNTYHITCKAINYEDVDSYEGCQIAFQTTSIGMEPDTLLSPIRRPKYLSKLDFAMDIIYNPRETRFMQDMQEMGIKTINGLSMLYNQAIRAFEIWQDIVIDSNVYESVFKEFITYLDKR